jgi:hypothetical protein
MISDDATAAVKLYLHSATFLLKRGCYATYRATIPKIMARVRNTPSWPRNRANFSLLWLYSYWNAWANLHRLGKRNTFLASATLILCIVMLSILKLRSTFEA